MIKKFDLNNVYSGVQFLSQHNSYMFNFVFQIKHFQIACSQNFMTCVHHQHTSYVPHTFRWLTLSSIRIAITPHHTTKCTSYSSLSDTCLFKRVFLIGRHSKRHQLLLQFYSTPCTCGQKLDKATLLVKITPAEKAKRK